MDERMISGAHARRMDAAFAGREFDSSLLNDLLTLVDPCGEKGEFHTFCYASPEFASEIAVEMGEVVERDGFVFADLRLFDAEWQLKANADSLRE